MSDHHASCVWRPAEIRIRAERRLGELLKAHDEMVGKNAGARGIGKSGVPSRNPTREQAGIDKKLSSRAQKLAAVVMLTLTWGVVLMLGLKSHLRFLFGSMLNSLTKPEPQPVRLRVSAPKRRGIG